LLFAVPFFRAGFTPLEVLNHKCHRLGEGQSHCQLQAGGGEERPSEEAQQAEEAPPAAHGAGEDGDEEAAAGAKLVADQLSDPSCAASWGKTRKH